MHRIYSNYHTPHNFLKYNERKQSQSGAKDIEQPLLPRTILNFYNILKKITLPFFQGFISFKLLGITLIIFIKTHFII